ATNDGPRVGVPAHRASGLGLRLRNAEVEAKGDRMNPVEHIVVKTEGGWRVARFLLSAGDQVRVFNCADARAYPTVAAALRAAAAANDSWLVTAEAPANPVGGPGE